MKAAARLLQVRLQCSRCNRASEAIIKVRLYNRQADTAPRDGLTAVFAVVVPPCREQRLGGACLPPAQRRSAPRR